MMESETFGQSNVFLCYAYSNKLDDNMTSSPQS